MIILKHFFETRSFQIRPMNEYIFQHKAENVKQDLSSDLTDLCDFFGVTLSLGISSL